MTRQRRWCVALVVGLCWSLALALGPPQPSGSGQQRLARAADCGPWSCWASRGGVLTDAPAAAGFNGRLYVFARGSDDALYITSSVDGAAFTPWVSLGGRLTAAPAAASVNGALYVLAKGSDNALYLKRTTDGVTFGEWENLGGVLTAPPAAAGVNGVLSIFAKGSDNGLYLKRSGDGVTFTDWQPLGGLLTAAPAAAGFQNQLYVFARGSDSALYSKRSADGVTFTDWQNAGGVLTSAPAAASYRPPGGAETLTVFAAGTDRALYERHTADGVGYTDWASLGGQVVGTPAAAGVGGFLFAVARSTDNALWETHTGSLAPAPSPMPPPAPGPAPPPGTGPPPTPSPTLSPTPSPTPTATPIVPPPPVARQIEYGFNAFLIGNTTSAATTYNTRTMGKVREAGFGWARFQLQWRELEPSPGAYDWTAADALVNAAAANGTKVLLSIAKAPDWANPARPGALPADPATFGRTMRVLATRYQGKVRAWEIWNEQNMAGEVGGSVEVGAYYETLKAAYGAVKGVDPSLFVLFGGLAPTGVNDPAIGIDDTVYLQQFYSYNGGSGRSYFDVLGAHAGSAANPPGTKYPENPGSGACPPQYASQEGTCWRNGGDFYFRRVEDDRAVMVRNGDGAKQVWVTEFGWDSCQTLPAPPGYEYCLLVSEQQQGQYLTGAFTLARDSWPWAGVLFVWNLNYATIPGIAQSDEKYAWSLLRSDFTNRPAFDAVKALPK